jgi:hypothetical protein
VTVSIDFFHLFDSAKRTPRGKAGFGCAHPATLVLGGQELEMSSNFVIEATIKLPSPKRRP